MGGIGRAIGSILAGAGEGLAAQADQDNKNALIEAQARRDAALEALRHADKTEELKTESGLIDTRDANHQARGFSYETKTTQQKQGFEQSNIRLKGNVDLAHDKTIEGLKHSNTLSEIQARSLADYQKDAKLNHTTPDHYEVLADGRIEIWNKDGSSRGAIGADGMFVPHNKQSDDVTGDGTIAGERTNRAPATPQAKSNPTAQAPEQTRQKDAALAALGNAYAKASQNPQQSRQQYPGMFDAQGNLLPKDVLIERVNKRYGG